MIKVNENYEKLAGNYLFAEIAKRTKEYQAKNPDKKVIRLGIGDVTQPLAPSVVDGLAAGAKEMGSADTFMGYRSDEGYEFLREAIRKMDFLPRGVDIAIDEIFITTGAKEDTANFQELFSLDTKVAVPDPVYPVYVDANVMAGRTGKFVDGRYEGLVYLDCSKVNDFTPELPKEPVDLICLCFPNNPTGQVITKDQLKRWVDYARKNKAVILYDAAYEAYIRDPEIPRSIFEIDGAKEVAVEFRSLSKTAGFTGTRLGYTIVPKDAVAYDSDNKPVPLNKLWNRRQATKFNGVAYLIQKGAYEVFTEKGRAECNKIISYYMENAKIIGDGLKSIGIDFIGGTNSPYIWLKTPGGLSSWDFFDKLINEIQVVGTPGAGFGKCGEGYFRLTSFGKREDVISAVERIKTLKI
ncbi:MAG: LL-diaminopimelate aminotransferase [Spirochaetes bacterium GWF1_51_8]|nr:MAG: LL-diaminopimelate aminotransferase [Spirochaetes bacterium GWF1_51_8]